METTDPQNELLDIVDASDVVIGSATRREIHEGGLRHRACHIVVFNDDGYVYLQKRSLTKDNNPGLWDTSSAGHVDSGESYVECAIRELGEELGLCTSESALTQEFKLEAEPLTGMEFAWVFSLRTSSPLHPDPIEISEGRWFEPAELTVWIEQNPAMVTGVFKMIWETLLEHSKQS